jgi:UDP-N-acetylmuramyl tripeptide synthase
MVKADGRLVAVIGSAGDRPDDALIELGRMAGAAADKVIGKDTVKYLRGRETGDIPALLTRGVNEAGVNDFAVFPSEYAAFTEALDFAEVDDAIVIMCIEDIDQVLARLGEIGVSIS